MGNVRKGRDIDSALCKKGLRREMDGKHIRYFFDGDQFFTMISHGMMGHTVDANLIARMSRQLHLAKRQFLDWVDCPLDEAGYREILRKQGIID